MPRARVGLAFDRWKIRPCSLSASADCKMDAARAVRPGLRGVLCSASSIGHDQHHHQQQEQQRQSKDSIGAGTLRSSRYLTVECPHVFPIVPAERPSSPVKPLAASGQPSASAYARSAVRNQQCAHHPSGRTVRPHQNRTHTTPKSSIYYMEKMEVQYATRGSSSSVDNLDARATAPDHPVLSKVYNRYGGPMTPCPLSSRPSIVPRHRATSTQP